MNTRMLSGNFQFVIPVKRDLTFLKGLSEDFVLMKSKDDGTEYVISTNLDICVAVRKGGYRPKSGFWMTSVLHNYDISGKNVLDLGCGETGILAHYSAARNANKVIGVDIDPSAISYVKKASLHCRYQIKWAVSNFFDNLTENKFIYILPMLILAISDPMAAILGINIKAYNGRIKLFGKKLNKTWLGSGAFLASSFVISIIALYFHRGVFDLKTFWLAMAVASTTMFAELISWRGSDNLSIPLSAVLILVLFL